MPSREPVPASAIPGPEEAAWVESAHRAAEGGDWPAAFLALQKALAAARGRGDAATVSRVLEEFAALQERSGDPKGALRTRAYRSGTFR